MENFENKAVYYIPTETRCVHGDLGCNPILPTCTYEPTWTYASHFARAHAKRGLGNRTLVKNCCPHMHPSPLTHTWFLLQHTLLLLLPAHGPFPLITHLYWQSLSEPLLCLLHLLLFEAMAWQQETEAWLLHYLVLFVPRAQRTGISETTFCGDIFLSVAGMMLFTKFLFSMGMATVMAVCWQIEAN